MFNNANICLKVLNLTYKIFLFLDDDGDKDGKILQTFYTIPVQNLSFVLGEKEPSTVKRGKATD